MKTSVLRASGSVVALMTVAALAADRAPVPVPLETLDLVLRDFSSIYPGLTRAEVKVLLRQDGGMFTPTMTRFVHPLCLYCKVTITFEPERDYNNRPKGISDSDKVTKVSKPYLEVMNLD
jgi:hypothetical protein